MANQFYTYKIVMDGESTGGESPATPDNQNEINIKQPSEKKQSQAKTAISTTIFQRIGTESVSFLTSNVGRWTGSKVQQNNINNAMKVIGYAGAFMANPVMAGIMLAVDIVTSAYDYTYELNLKNMEASENARRLGTLNNRSR